MDSIQRRDTELRQYKSNRNAHIFMVAAGLVAIALTFFLSASEETGGAKIMVLGVVCITYIFACLGSLLITRRRLAEEGTTEPANLGRDDFDDIESRLVALDEANQFFGSSLNAADMFRLVSSRVSEIFPFAACALFVPDEMGDKLTVAQFEGRNEEMFQDLELKLSEGLSGKAFASGAIEIDEGLATDKRAITADKLKGFRSAVAIPILQGKEIIGVFEMFTDHAVKNDEDTIKLLEAIGEHVTPLFRSSMAFDQSISSALTDVLTGLPNERAFFMVLENQLAESMRYRDERPLTVVAIDIKDFAEANAELGHAVGDRMLEFVGDRIKEQLRKMDFLARSMNDEFALILPTASEKTAIEIMERIKVVFAQTPFAISDDEHVKIWLNFGWATFWKDGESTNQLIRHAQLRKQQEKSEEPAGVLWFPKEYVN